MNEQLMHDIFKRGSRTYFYSSLFFPASVRRDVFCLYAFVRTADDFVDTVPADRSGFFRFVSRFRAARKADASGNPVVDSFVELEARKGFDPAWADSFLSCMEADLEHRPYRSLKQVESYMFGSAEVIGLFMSRILGLPRDTEPYARCLGRAMQYMNFIRDIREDWCLGRNYFPQTDLREAGLPSLSPMDARENPAGFRRFVHAQLGHYTRWEREGVKGLALIPARYRVPIKTAAQMYEWTGHKICRDPFVVFREKVKPSVPRILAGLGYNALGSVVPG